jgi:2-dehydro-3-deoxyphosphogluconate aldolase/(4S)-4-hydroxy-2-oxoglutarate aldolase
MNTMEVMRTGPVIPVIVIDNPDDAVPLARALMAGGIRVLEITLRTPVAMQAVRTLCRQFPDAIVGVGTITRPEDFAEAKAAGAMFGVSPGLTPALIDAQRETGLPWLPGCMTPSDILVARAAGISALKLFPAQQAGGTGMLKALAGVFPGVMFCPTGGITADNAADFLALPNVTCVGGSWLTPKDALARGDWPRITELARAASSLRAHT